MSDTSDLAADVERITTYPRDEWLTDIEFPDGMDDTATSPPVHVHTKPVRVNGYPLTDPGAILPKGIPAKGIPVGYGLTRDTIVVESRFGEDGTKVSFEVFADDVEWADWPVVVGVSDEGDPVMGTRRGAKRLFGLQVLSPAEIDWVVSDNRYHDHVAEHGKDDPGPTVIDGEPVTCRVVLFARTVAFSQRPGRD